MDTTCPFMLGFAVLCYDHTASKNINVQTDVISSWSLCWTATNTEQLKTGTWTQICSVLSFSHAKHKTFEWGGGGDVVGGYWIMLDKHDIFITHIKSITYIPLSPAPLASLLRRCWRTRSRSLKWDVASPLFDRTAVICSTSFDIWIDWKS
jgi:hypothetical protein